MLWGFVEREDSANPTFYHHPKTPPSITHRKSKDLQCRCGLTGIECRFGCSLQK